MRNYIYGGIERYSGFEHSLVECATDRKFPFHSTFHLSVINICFRMYSIMVKINSSIVRCNFSPPLGTRKRKYFFSFTFDQNTENWIPVEKYCKKNIFDHVTYFDEMRTSGRIFYFRVKSGYTGCPLDNNSRRGALGEN